MDHGSLSSKRDEYSSSDIISAMDADDNEIVDSVQLMAEINEYLNEAEISDIEGSNKHKEKSQSISAGVKKDTSALIVSHNLDCIKRNQPYVLLSKLETQKSESSELECSVKDSENLLFEDDGSLSELSVSDFSLSDIDDDPKTSKDSVTGNVEPDRKPLNKGRGVTSQRQNSREGKLSDSKKGCQIKASTASHKTIENSVQDKIENKNKTLKHTSKAPWKEKKLQSESHSRERKEDMSRKNLSENKSEAQLQSELCFRERKEDMKRKDSTGKKSNIQYQSESFSKEKKEDIKKKDSSEKKDYTHQIQSYSKEKKEVKRKDSSTENKDWRYELTLSNFSLVELDNESFRKFTNLASDCAFDFDSSTSNKQYEGNVKLYFGDFATMLCGMQKLGQVSFSSSNKVKGEIIGLQAKHSTKISSSDKWRASKRVELSFNLYTTWTEKLKQYIQVKDWKKGDKKVVKINQLPPAVSKDMLSLLFPFSLDSQTLPCQNVGKQSKFSYSAAEVFFSSEELMSTVLCCFQDLVVSLPNEGLKQFKIVAEFRPTAFPPGYKSQTPAKTTQLPLQNEHTRQGRLFPGKGLSSSHSTPHRQSTSLSHSHKHSYSTSQPSPAQKASRQLPGHKDSRQPPIGKGNSSSSAYNMTRKRLSTVACEEGGASLVKRSRFSQPNEKETAAQEKKGANSVAPAAPSQSGSMEEVRHMALTQGLDPNNNDVLCILEMQRQLLSMQSLMTSSNSGGGFAQGSDTVASQGSRRGPQPGEQGRASSSQPLQDTGSANMEVELELEAAELKLRETIALRQRQLQELELKLKASKEKSSSSQKAQLAQDHAGKVLFSQAPPPGLNDQPLDFKKPQPKVEEAVKEDEIRSRMTAKETSLPSTKPLPFTPRQMPLKAEDLALPLHFGKNVEKLLPKVIEQKSYNRISEHKEKDLDKREGGNQASAKQGSVNQSRSRERSYGEKRDGLSNMGAVRGRADTQRNVGHSRGRGRDTPSTRYPTCQAKRDNWESERHVSRPGSSERVVGREMRGRDSCEDMHENRNRDVIYPRSHPPAGFPDENFERLDRPAEGRGFARDGGRGMITEDQDYGRFGSQYSSKRALKETRLDGLELRGGHSVRGRESRAGSAVSRGTRPHHGQGAAASQDFRKDQASCVSSRWDDCWTEDNQDVHAHQDKSASHDWDAVAEGMGTEFLSRQMGSGGRTGNLTNRQRPSGSHYWHEEEESYTYKHQEGDITPMKEGHNAGQGPWNGPSQSEWFGKKSASHKPKFQEHEPHGKSDVYKRNDELYEGGTNVQNEQDWYFEAEYEQDYVEGTDRGFAARQDRDKRSHFRFGEDMDQDKDDVSWSTGTESSGLIGRGRGVPRGRGGETGVRRGGIRGRGAPAMKGVGSYFGGNSRTEDSVDGLGTQPGRGRGTESGQGRSAVRGSVGEFGRGSKNIGRTGPQFGRGRGIESGAGRGGHGVSKEMQGRQDDFEGSRGMHSDPEREDFGGSRGIESRQGMHDFEGSRGRESRQNDFGGSGGIQIGSGRGNFGGPRGGGTPSERGRGRGVDLGNARGGGNGRARREDLEENDIGTDFGRGRGGDFGRGRSGEIGRGRGRENGRGRGGENGRGRSGEIGRGRGGENGRGRGGENGRGRGGDFGRGRDGENRRGRGGEIGRARGGENGRGRGGDFGRGGESGRGRGGENARGRGERRRVDTGMGPEFDIGRGEETGREGDGGFGRGFGGIMADGGNVRERGAGRGVFRSERGVGLSDAERGGRGGAVSGSSQGLRGRGGMDQGRGRGELLPGGMISSQRQPNSSDEFQFRRGEEFQESNCSIPDSKRDSYYSGAQNIHSERGRGTGMAHRGSLGRGEGHRVVAEVSGRSDGNGRGCSFGGRGVVTPSSQSQQNSFVGSGDRNPMLQERGFRGGYHSGTGTHADTNTNVSATRGWGGGGGRGRGGGGGPRGRGLVSHAARGGVNFY